VFVLSITPQKVLGTHRRSTAFTPGLKLTTSAAQLRNVWSHNFVPISGVPRNFFLEGGVSPGIFFSGGDSTNSVEDRGQREQRSWGGSPLVRGSTQFANE
jgi:hypothetical protein